MRVELAFGLAPNAFNTIGAQTHRQWPINSAIRITFSLFGDKGSSSNNTSVASSKTSAASNPLSGIGMFNALAIP